MFGFVKRSFLWPCAFCTSQTSLLHSQLAGTALLDMPLALKLPPSRAQRSSICAGACVAKSSLL